MMRIVATIAVVFLATSSLPGQERQKAMLRVFLPVANTRLEIQGQTLKPTDKDVRLFESPPLEAGKSYVYDIKATWTENGKEQTRERSVKVLAGRTTEVDLRLAVDTSPNVIPPASSIPAGDKPADKPADKPVDKPADKPVDSAPDKSFIAPPPLIVEAMLKLARVRDTDVVYDLASGDGRIAIAAIDVNRARKAIGYETNAARLAQARKNAIAIAEKVEFRPKDPLTLTSDDLADATVVMLGTSTPDQLMKLAPMLKKLKVGTRIVTHEFEIPGMKSDDKRELTDDKLDHLIFLYVIK